MILNYYKKLLLLVLISILIYYVLNKCINRKEGLKFMKKKKKKKNKGGNEQEKIEEKIANTIKIAIAKKGVNEEKIKKVEEIIDNAISTGMVGINQRNIQ